MARSAGEKKGRGNKKVQKKGSEHCSLVQQKRICTLNMIQGLGHVC